MARREKKNKRLLRGRVVAFVTLVGSLAFLLTFICNYISGVNPVGGYKNALGFFDWPVLSGFNLAQNGIYYQLFIENVDLALSPFAFSTFMKFLATYGLTLALALSIVCAALNFIVSAKNLLFGRMRVKLEKLTLITLLASVIWLFATPLLIIGELSYMETFGKFIFFQLDYKPGILALLSILIAAALFVFPYIVRALYKINYRINTLEKNAIAKSTDKRSFRQSKKYDKGYKSFR